MKIRTCFTYQPDHYTISLAAGKIVQDVDDCDLEGAINNLTRKGVLQELREELEYCGTSSPESWSQVELNDKQFEKVKEMVDKLFPTFKREA